MSEYMGEDRRNHKPGKPGELSLVLSGQRMPMLTLAGVVGGLIAFFIAAVVYFVKIDDRTLNNATNIAKNSQIILEQQKLMHNIQKSQVKVSTIQQGLLNELEAHEQKRWHEAAGLEIQRLKAQGKD